MTMTLKRGLETGPGLGVMLMRIRISIGYCGTRTCDESSLGMSAFRSGRYFWEEKQ